MHNTPLDLRLWEYCMNGIPESGQSIYGYDHDIFHTSVFYLVENGQPVFRTFISSYPHAENLTFSIQFNTYSNVNSFFYRSIVFSNMLSVDSFAIPCCNPLRIFSPFSL